MESREDCLREASECDRLANLANTRATRALLALAAFQWRKLADKAAERQKRSLAIGAGSDASKLVRAAPKVVNASTHEPGNRFAPASTS